MRDLFPKFVIEDGNLIISKCTYHRELVTDKDKVRGGGWFKFEDGAFIFYGKSEDFGTATLEDIQKAVSEGRVFTNSFCEYSIANEHKFFYDSGSELIPLN